MRDVIPEIERAGARLIMVGNGTAPMLRDFLDDFGRGLTAYTDPERRVYHALGARRPGPAALLKPRSWRNAIRAFRRGFRQTGVRGDARQLGGVWVANAAGDVVLDYRSEVAGDYPVGEEILAAVEQVTSAR